MPTCKGQLSDGESCPINVETGATYCHWHDPENETWIEIYARLEKSTPDEKVKIVLELMKDHPEHILVLPERNGKRANLSNINLSREELQKTLSEEEFSSIDWATIAGGVHLWDADLRGANLEGANLKDLGLQSANFQKANLKNANLQGADLTYTNFQEAELRSANLRSPYLDNSNFQGAKLQLADFEGADLMFANFESATLWGVNFKNAHLEIVNFQNSSLLEANFEGASLISSDFRNAALPKANLEKANLEGANFQGAGVALANFSGANLQYAKLQGVTLSEGTKIPHIYISNAWLDKTRIKKEQLGNAIGEEQDHDYGNAKYGYLVLKQNFDDLGDYEAASWAYRKERRMEKLEAWQNKKYLKSLSDTIVELLCDYGESVWRVVGWMAVLLFIVGPLLFSGLGGIEWSAELKKEYFELSSFVRFGFWYRTYLLYTLDTLTTASFSGLQPINDSVKFASGFFAIAGIFLAGLLGFVAGNRIRRS